MRQICLFALTALVFLACPVYDSLPEPELELIEIVFSSASYEPSGPSIFLEFQTPVSYHGIYPFYNKSREFSMRYYLKNPIAIRRTIFNETGITIELFAGSSNPGNLVFNTNIPWYFYRRISYNDIIEAKAFIKTPDITF